MTVKSLSNPELVERFNKLVRTERKITHLVLECIAEIDRRKLYAQKTYSSLYEYLVNEFGYSPSAANRRIASARLLREVPEMAEKIESGALNLSQLSKLQQAIRTVQKTENRKMEVTEKRELLLKIENTTQERTELILAQELNLPVEVIDKTKLHRDESVTLTVTLSKEQMALLQKVGDSISHAVPEKKWAQVLTYLAQKELDRRTKKRSANKLQSTNEKQLNTIKESKSQAVLGFITKGGQPNKQGEVDQARDRLKIKAADPMPIPSMTCLDSTSLTDVKIPQRRAAIPTVIRKTLLHADAICEYRHPDGKQCANQRFLQIDHIKSWSSGGTSDLENLQVLCGVHNRLKYAMECDGFEGLSELRLARDTAPE